VNLFSGDEALVIFVRRTGLKAMRWDGEKENGERENGWEVGWN
jgi:hypothetical protein